MGEILFTVPFQRGRVMVLAGDSGAPGGLAFDVSGDGDAGPPLTSSGESLSALAGELGAYFAGQDVRWSFVPDLSRETAFRRAVYRRVMQIPFGETATYGQVAREAGYPGAARAVGQAMASNRFPVIIPCHRVVGARGRLGGFSSGLQIKKYLLALEGGPG